MPSRALLLAFQEYPNAVGPMSTTLEGTHQLLTDLFDWLVNSRGLLPSDIVVASDLNSAHLVARGADAANLFPGTTAGYRQSVFKLINVGAGSTQELFVLYSGHGVQAPVGTGPSPALPPDCLLTVDFDPVDRGLATYSLAELRVNLSSQLGPGSHFYFIDACRHSDSTWPNPAVLTSGFNQIPGDPRQFTVFSTERGTTAATDSGFAPALLSGLGGETQAATWVDQRFGVFWTSLRTFLKAKTVGQAVDSDRRPDTADELFVEQMPPPRFACTIACNTAGVDLFDVVIDGPTEAPVTSRVQSQQRNMLPVTHLLPPGKYFVSVSGPSGRCQRVDAAPGDSFFDFTGDASLTYLTPTAPPMPSQVPPGPSPIVAAVPSAGTVSYSGDGATRVEIASTNGPAEPVAFDLQADPIELGRGRYLARAIDRRSGVKVGDYEFELGPEGLDLTGMLVPPDTAMQRDLRTVLPSGFDWVDFSESLRGRVVDPDIGVWLALLGASAIVADPQSFTKMRNVSLFDARESRPPSSLFVLSDVPLAKHAQVLSPGAIEPVQAKVNISNITDLWWAGADALEPGSHLLDVTLNDRESFSLATYTAVGRATLITLARRNGRISIGQFVLPIADREAARGASERALYETIASHGPLWWILYSAQLQRAFGRHERLATNGEESLWEDLLDGKWVDPIMSVVAAHELVRVGSLERLPVVVDNLRNHFPGLPDTEYLARFANMPSEGPSAPPLVLEAALGSGWSDHPVSSERRLDFEGPWTVWR